MKYPGVTVVAVEVLQVEIQALIAEKLAAGGAHPVRHFGPVELAEKQKRELQKLNPDNAESVAKWVGVL